MLSKLAGALLLVLFVLSVGPLAVAGQSPEARLPYQKPGTAAAGGIHHLVLIYAGGPTRVRWDPEKLLP